MNSMKTGKLISECRKQKGLTQKELAQMLSISNRTVSKWENGDGYPDVTLMPQLSQILGVSVDELLAGETDEVQVNEQKKILFEAAVPQNRKNYNKLFRFAYGIKVPIWCRIAYILCLIISVFTVYCSETVTISPGMNVTLIVCAVLMLLSLFTPEINTLLHMNRVKEINGKNISDEIITVTDEKIILVNGVNSGVFNLSDITGFYDKDDIYIIRLHRKAFAYVTKESFTLGDSESFAAFIRGRMTVVKEKKPTKIFITVLTICIIALTSVLFCLTIVMNANHYTYEEYMQLDSEELLNLRDDELCYVISSKISAKGNAQTQTLNECEKVFFYVDNFYYNYDEYGFCEYLYYYHPDENFEGLYSALDTVGLNEISLQIKDFVEANRIDPMEFNSKTDYDVLYKKYPFEQFDKKLSQQYNWIESKLADYARDHIESF